VVAVRVLGRGLALGVAAGVVGQVDRDAVEPRARIIDPRPLRVGPGEGLSDDVFGIERRAAVVPDETEQVIAVRPVEQGECRLWSHRPSGLRLWSPDGQRRLSSAVRRSADADPPV
jgi:hypothetical protein